jgi:hypothetical protein
VHDIVDLEGRGIPSVYVASSEFKAAGEAQATALGYDPAAVFVPHPIQDRSDGEMREIAHAAVQDLIAAITSHGERG